GRRATRSGRWHTGLDVVGIHDRFSDIHSRPRHHHDAARPRLRSVKEKAVTVVNNIFLNDGSHLGEDFISDLARLILEVFLCVLRSAVETLLLRLDLFHQLVARFIVQLILLGAELFLEAVDFVGQTLQFVLFGFELLGKRGEFALSFVGGGDRLFDVEGTDFGAIEVGSGRRRSGGRVRRSGSRGSVGSRVGLGQSEEREAEYYQGDARKLLNPKLLNHWVLLTPSNF